MIICIFNISTQMLCLCDGIPYVFMVLDYPWIKRCHGNLLWLCDGIPYVFMVLDYPWIKRCHGNLRHIFNKKNIV